MRSLSTWFAYGFAVLTLAALVVAAAINGGQPSWIWFWSAVLLGAMSIAFFGIENISAALLLASFKLFRRQREVAEGLRLAGSLPDNDLRHRLYIALSLHLAGAKPDALTTSRPQRALPPVTAKIEKRCRRRGGRGRRRGGQRGFRLVRVFCW